MSRPSRPAVRDAHEPEQKASRSRKRRLPKVVSKDEAERMLASLNLDAPTSLRDRCMFELMYRSGLRVSEVCSLLPRDVGWADGTIRIESGKTGDGTAYFDESVDQLLELWRRERRRIKPPAESPLFVTLDGTPVLPRHLQRKLKIMARRAGVDPRKITPHVFRHTFATQLYAETRNIRLVQEALRHADLRNTMIYTHILDADVRDTIRQRAR